MPVGLPPTRRGENAVFVLAVSIVLALQAKSKGAMAASRAARRRAEAEVTQPGYQPQASVRGPGPVAHLLGPGPDSRPTRGPHGLVATAVDPPPTGPPPHRTCPHLADDRPHQRRSSTRARDSSSGTIEEKIPGIVCRRILSMKGMVGDDVETMREIERLLIDQGPGEKEIG
jgi:hypothetical protein